MDVARRHPAPAPLGALRRSGPGCARATSTRSASSRRTRWRPRPYRWTLEYDMTSSLAAEAAGVAEEEEKAASRPSSSSASSSSLASRTSTRAMDGELERRRPPPHGLLAANIEAPRERAVSEKLRAHADECVRGAAEGEEGAARGVRGAEGGAGARRRREEDQGAHGRARRSRDPDVDRDYVQYCGRTPPTSRSSHRGCRVGCRRWSSSSFNTAGAVSRYRGGRHLARYLRRDHRRAATFSSVIEFHNLQAQVTAANGALREVHNLPCGGQACRWSTGGRASPVPCRLDARALPPLHRRRRGLPIQATPATEPKEFRRRGLERDDFIHRRFHDYSYKATPSRHCCRSPEHHLETLDHTASIYLRGDCSVPSTRTAIPTASSKLLAYIVFGHPHSSSSTLRVRWIFW